jgi:cyclic-di-AMP phosphodiesterase PgpH
MDSSSDSSNHPPSLTVFTVLEKRCVVALLLSVFLIFTFVFSYFYDRRQDLSIGDIAPYNLVSPSTQAFFNRIKTEELRKQAEEKVSIIYRKNPSILDAVFHELSFLSSALRTERINRLKTDEEKLLEIIKHLGDSEKARQTSLFLIQTDEQNLNDIFEYSRQIIRVLLDRGLQEDDLIDIEPLIKARIDTLNLHNNIQPHVLLVSAKKILPNMSIDEDATNRQKEEARQKIVPVRETIIQNEILVEKGSKISAEDYDRLVAVGLISETQVWHDLLRAFIYSLLLGILLFLFVAFKQKQEPVIGEWKYFILLFSILVFFVFLVRVFAPINQFVVPVFIFAILIRVFFKPLLSSYFSFLVILMSLMIFGVDYALIAVYLIASFVAMVFYARFKTFTDFLVKGVYSSLVLVLLALLFLYYFPENILYSQYFLNLGLIFANGMIASLICLGIVVLIGNFTDFVTPLRLFELSDPNSILLRKLFEEAPGTYQHSIMIANLASHAADAIGADPLIARVGSYYHDIGKTISPLSFTENNSGKNLLDEMEPMEAVTIIKSHIEHGLQLAKKFRLPSFINRFITSHHGDNRISFMYEMARKKEPSLTDDTLFRYPGPKPISKEVSIVMLADSVEAAARSLQEKTQENLSKLVDDIIESKTTNHQLDESDLTFSDLKLIKKSFLFTLDSLYHVRLSYPDANKAVASG